MESSAFDELSKALATGRSRRTILRGLAGGVLAGVATFGSRSVVARAQNGSGEQGDEGDPCSEVLTCGPGLVCTEGYCAANGSGEQGDEGDPCSEVLTCGPGLVCSEGYCAANGSGEQGDEGDPCSEVLTCGPDLVCRKGTCQKITLPSTGSGPNDQMPGHATGNLLGAAALAGAGAWVLRHAHSNGGENVQRDS